MNAGVIQETVIRDARDSVLENPATPNLRTKSFEGGDPNEPLNDNKSHLGLQKVETGEMQDDAKLYN